MILLGYFFALLIGVSLGVTGSGGAILTMPLLVYLFHVSPTLATSYTLCIVGAVSLVGAVNSYKKGLVDLKALSFFGCSSILAVCLVRRFFIPSIPEHLFSIHDYRLSYSKLTMLLFACFMLLSATSMLRGSKGAERHNAGQNNSIACLLLSGFGLGILTGLLGIGGGFIIIPALVILLGIPMKTAIGTSLSIISLNSFFGFMASVNQAETDWGLMISVIVIAVIGLLAGTTFSSRLPNEKLKKVFGCVVLVIGVSILLKEMSVVSLLSKFLL